MADTSCWPRVWVIGDGYQDSTASMECLMEYYQQSGPFVMVISSSTPPVLYQAARFYATYGVIGVERYRCVCSKCGVHLDRVLVLGAITKADKAKLRTAKHAHIPVSYMEC